MYLFVQSVLSKLYRIWICSIEIILEKDTLSTIKPSISSQKFVYPETIITDLSRKI
jgi:hypothetical protein